MTLEHELSRPWLSVPRSLRFLLGCLLFAASGLGFSSVGLRPRQRTRLNQLLSDDELSTREEDTMSRAPQSNLRQMTDVTVASLVSEMESKGVSRIDSLLTESQTREMLEFINAELSLSIKTVDDFSVENDNFSLSKAQYNRWDLKLPIADGAILDRTMKILCKEGSLLGDTLQKIVGTQGRIHELAAFVTVSGATRQIIHTDSSWTALPSLFTCTISLQDIDIDMGPTVFIPGSHTEDAHLVRMEEFMLNDIDSKDSILLDLPHELSMLRAGDAALYDSRILHCGGANRSMPNKARVLLYFSVATQLSDESLSMDELFDPDQEMEGARLTRERDASLRTASKGLALSDFR